MSDEESDKIITIIVPPSHYKQNDEEYYPIITTILQLYEKEFKLEFKKESGSYKVEIDKKDSGSYEVEIDKTKYVWTLLHLVFENSVVQFKNFFTNYGGLLRQTPEFRDFLIGRYGGIITEFRETSLECFKNNENNLEFQLGKNVLILSDFQYFKDKIFEKRDIFEQPKFHFFFVNFFFFHFDKIEKASKFDKKCKEIHSNKPSSDLNELQSNTMLGWLLNPQISHVLRGYFSSKFFSTSQNK